MMPVKICGMTNPEDALCAAQNGAAAVGFIFYPPSPRYIEPVKVGRIIDELPQNLVKIGVFVNEEASAVQKIFDDCRLDMIQLHGDETPDYCAQFPKDRIIKALELKTAEDIRKARRYDVIAILADSRHAGLYGGTGRTSNWNRAAQMEQPLILSGGLKEDNVIEALRKAGPAALDINSGVEIEPGRKDPEKIRRIMQIIRDCGSGGQPPQIFRRRETV